MAKNVSAHRKKYGELQAGLCWVWLGEEPSIHQPGGKGFVAYRSLGIPDFFGDHLKSLGSEDERGAVPISQVYWERRKMDFRCPSLVPCSAPHTGFTALP